MASSGPQSNEPAPPVRRSYGADPAISVLDFGGEGPPVLLHHANGFCGGMWGEVAAGLTPHFRVFAVDARGHGHSEKPRDPASYQWKWFASDLAETGRALLRETGSECFAMGIGHSFGGAATLAAAADNTDLYERILLIDPVIPPPPNPKADQIRSNRGGELAAGARRRRHQWATREEARQYFLERPFFQSWTPGAIDLYVEHGLVDDDDGVVLACPGEVEAMIFESNGTLDLFGAAPRVATPALLLWATRGDFPRPLYEALAAQMKSARVEDAGAGHLVPMERPDLVIEVALRWSREA